jgi:methionine biosynthesis protein MetW
MVTQQQVLPLNGIAPQPAISYRGDHLLVAEMVERGSKVLDVGCGEGDLLLLLESRGIDGRGIELSREGVNRCVAKGLAVVQGDADTDLVNYPDDAFDYVILSQTLQATRQPRVVLENLLRIGRRAIVSFPNFGFWKMRLQLLVGGHMPAPSRISCSSATRSTSRWSARWRSISTAGRCGSICRGGSGTCSASRACSC